MNTVVKDSLTVGGWVLSAATIATIYLEIPKSRAFLTALIGVVLLGMILRSAPTFVSSIKSVSTTGG